MHVVVERKIMTIGNFIMITSGDGLTLCYQQTQTGTLHTMIKTFKVVHTCYIGRCDLPRGIKKKQTS